MVHVLQLTKHFGLDEFRCPDCGKVEVSYVIPYLLERIRIWLGKPLIITSGYRCPDHNFKVGGSPDSLHLSGRAVDIITEDLTSQELAWRAFEVGFSSCLCYPKKGHTHCQLQGKLEKGVFQRQENGSLVKLRRTS